MMRTGAPGRTEAGAVGAPASGAPLRIRAAVRSDPGLVRRRNEDAYAFFPDLSLYAVADGMGGHAAGQVASSLAVDALRSAVIDTAGEDLTPLSGPGGEHSVDARRLGVAIEHANQVVLRAGRDDPARAGMGTTIAALVLDCRARKVAIGHVGDSRVYRVRGDRIDRLTQDHTLVQRLVNEGRITPEEAAGSNDRHILTQAIGADVLVSPALRFDALAPGDVFVLCSDGVHGAIPDDEMLRVVRDGADAPDALCERLIALANARGGRDNSTVVIIACDEPVDDRPAEQA